MHETNWCYEYGAGSFVYGVNRDNRMFGNKTENIYYELGGCSVGYTTFYGDGYLMLFEYEFYQKFINGDGICDETIVMK